MGGKQNPKAGILAPGTIETSYANASVPAELAQSYWEKKWHSASSLNGDRSTDAVHAMRSTIMGPISSHIALNAAGAMLMMTSRDPREIASATGSLAVGIRFNDNMKPYSTCSTCKQLHQQRVSLAVLGLPTVNRPHHRLVVHVYENLPTATRPGVVCRTAAGDGRGRTSPSVDMLRQPVWREHPPRGESARVRVDRASRCDEGRIRRSFHQGGREVPRTLPRPDFRGNQCSTTA